MSFGAPLTRGRGGGRSRTPSSRATSRSSAALVAEMLIPRAAAQIAHLACRTGYPDPLVAEKMPTSIARRRRRARRAAHRRGARQGDALHRRADAATTCDEALPTPLHEGALHARLRRSTRSPTPRAAPRCSASCAACSCPGGQALLALPLRGSFPEINDMVREFALRQDLTELGKAVDAAAASRPTIETISEEFENAGLTEVDVDVQLIAVSFSDGREFLEDPDRPAHGLPGDARPALARQGDRGAVLQVRARRDLQVLVRGRLRAHGQRRLRLRPQVLGRAHEDARLPLRGRDAARARGGDGRAATRTSSR